MVKYIFLDEFDLNFDFIEEVRTVNELMAILFWHQKRLCHEDFKRFKMLEKAIQSHFQLMKLDNWNKYCEIISSTDY